MSSSWASLASSSSSSAKRRDSPRALAAPPVVWRSSSSAFQQPEQVASTRRGPRRRPRAAPRRLRDLGRREALDKGRRGKARTEVGGSGCAQKVEHEYSGWERAPISPLGPAPRPPLQRLEPRSGIAPFGRLVEQLMGTEPYASARLLLDRRQRLLPIAAGRDQPPPGAVAEPVLIHLPVHASWRQQVEIY